MNCEFFWFSCVGDTSVDVVSFPLRPPSKYIQESTFKLWTFSTVSLPIDQICNERGECGINDVICCWSIFLFALLTLGCLFGINQLIIQVVLLVYTTLSKTRLNSLSTKTFSPLYYKVLPRFCRGVDNSENLRTPSARIPIRAERKDSRILPESRVFVTESCQPLGFCNHFPNLTP